MSGEDYGKPKKPHVLRASEPGLHKGLTFARFTDVNVKRCEAATGFNHAVGSWSLSDWMTATMVELGEAANIVKKLNRVRDGIRGNKETEHALWLKLRQELADAFIYLDLMIYAARGTTEEAVIETWNAKSKQIGYKPAPYKFKYRINKKEFMKP